MQDKRMFDRKLVSSDAFTSMPISAQGLFFHLCMRADDDGFVDKVNGIIKDCNATKGDLDALIAKCYVLTFPKSNVIAIKHWKLHNEIQEENYTPTVYVEEKAMLYEKKNGAYTFDPKKAGNNQESKIQKLEGQMKMVKEIIAYLNEKCDTNFRYNANYSKNPIIARMNEGNYTVEDFKTVIDKKTEDWYRNPKMRKYIRPETLFGNKFDGYLNQLREENEYDDWGKS